MQGEFQLKIRQMEDELLQKLSESKGNILDNSDLINTLDVLKENGQKIMEEMAKSNEILSQVEETTKMYQPLSNTTSQIYFIIRNLTQL